jgi:hypothetical protein
MKNKESKFFWERKPAILIKFAPQRSRLRWCTGLRGWRKASGSNGSPERILIVSRDQDGEGDKKEEANITLVAILSLNRDDLESPEVHALRRLNLEENGRKLSSRSPFLKLKTTHECKTIERNEETKKRNNKIISELEDEIRDLKRNKMALSWLTWCCNLWCSIPTLGIYSC